MEPQKKNAILENNPLVCCVAVVGGFIKVDSLCPFTVIVTYEATRRNGANLRM